MTGALLAFGSVAVLPATPAAATLEPGAIGALPRAAGTTAPLPSAGTDQTVTLYVPSPNLPALLDLARQAPATARADRLARLATLLPQAGARDEVADRARALGLTVTAETTWSVQARGPATLVRALFGSSRTVRPRSPIAQALPQLPAALAGRVTAVVGGDEVRQGLRHRADAPVATPMAGPAAIPSGSGYTGDQLRSAYATTLASGATPTIATLQLSGWDSSNLTAYATAAGLPDPVASGQYTAISVAGGDPTTPSDSGYDTEVALDQEALLGVAPAAKQRMYVAPNTDPGYLAILDTVRQDAVANSSLMALSISWGGCEADWSPSVVNQAEAEFAALAVAGVTTFAASGDSGARDCGGSLLSVDYPASSPHVVGVGGTTLRGSGSTWTETAWNGSGGGCSTLFARPGWQPVLASCAGKRQVPDISSDANPSTGFAVYLDGWGPVGGTSLGAPTSAGLLADEWQRLHRTAGYGDIHARLYTAPATAFRDVRSGSNGYPATVGNDLVTGRGSPLWDSLAAALSGTTPPPVSPTPTVTPTRRGRGPAR